MWYRCCLRRRRSDVSSRRPESQRASDRSCLLPLLFSAFYGVPWESVLCRHSGDQRDRGRSAGSRTTTRCIVLIRILVFWMALLVMISLAAHALRRSLQASVNLALEEARQSAVVAAGDTRADRLPSIGTWSSRPPRGSRRSWLLRAPTTLVGASTSRCHGDVRDDACRRATLRAWRPFISRCRRTNTRWFAPSSRAGHR